MTDELPKGRVYAQLWEDPDKPHIWRIRVAEYRWYRRPDDTPYERTMVMDEGPFHEFDAAMEACRLWESTANGRSADLTKDNR